jgi:hypothetical protein
MKLETEGLKLETGNWKLERRSPVDWKVSSKSGGVEIRTEKNAV